MKLVCILIICTLVIGVVYGLHERSVLEKQCHEIHPDPQENIDYDWVTSVDTWYFPHASKLHGYRVASEVKSTPINEIKDHHYYHNSCIIVKWGKREHPVMYGFDGQELKVEVTPIGHGRALYESAGRSATMAVTLTDNKTFQFFYVCWSDGESSWGVLSTSKELGDETEEIIFQHAKSLGFNEEHFTQHSYGICEDIIEDDVATKDEL